MSVSPFTGNSDRGFASASTSKPSVSSSTRGISFEREKRIDVTYKQWTIPGQKVDLLVGGVVIVELKAVPRLRRIHGAQILSYADYAYPRRPSDELQRVIVQERPEKICPLNSS